MIRIGSAQWGYGGKLTTYRATAECVMQVLPVLPGRGPVADTPQHCPLMGTQVHERVVVAMEND
jgi:hypothetical protein